MTRRRDDTLVISSPAQLKAMGTPQRVRILEALLACAPQSIREVAAALMRPPAALYHHFGVLAAAGLIVEAGTRGEGRTAETLYRPAAASIRADINPRSTAARAALARTGETHVRYALRRFSRAVREGAAPLSGAQRPVSVRHLALRLSPMEIEALNRDLDILVRKWSKAQTGDVALSLLLMMAPEKP